MEDLRIEDGLLIIVHAGGHEYPIEVSRFDTHEKILAWALQLSEKSWMSVDDLNRVLTSMLHHHGLDYPQT